MLSLALGIGATRLFILLRRTRWILIALLLVYAFTTPGEPWFAQLGALSPSHEGVEDGLMQLLRLVTVLAGLAILLTQLATAQLISGLYSLAYPLHCLGVPRERIVVRLALTLRYAENAMLDNARDGMRSLDNLMAPVQAAPENIELKLLPLSGRDWLLLFTGCALVLGVLL